MPNGIPVATVALNGAKNAGILAASILSTGSKAIEKKLVAFKTNMKNEVVAKAKALKGKGYENKFD
jgi:5-(carboxyamino)imidazole ribonucleotide mutase